MTTTEELLAHLSPALRHAMTWRLVAEFFRRHSAELWACGISPELGREALRVVVAFPRYRGLYADFPLGAAEDVHFHNPAPLDMGNVWDLSLWGINPDEPLNHICPDIGLGDTHDHPLPTTTRTTLTYRTIAALLASKLFGGASWTCSNLVDWPGDNATPNVRQDVLARFPELRVAAPTGTMLEGMIGQAPFGYWVIERADSPQALLRTDAVAHLRDGSSIDLYEIFNSTRRPGRSGHILRVVATLEESLPLADVN